jgi:tetratricopeptide (TPR) repeat protein
VESAGTGAVVEPLLSLEREDLTGVLEFVAQGITTRIFVRAGEIIFADAGTVGETLGRMLIRSGRLTEEHVAAIIRHMTDSLIDGRYIRFGEVLIEHGFLTGGELDIALTQQVKEKLMGCVHRGTGAWSFTRNDSRVEDVGSYVLRTRPMLVDATAHLPERRLETVLVLNQNRFPEVVAPESILIEEFELSRTEAAVLRDLDGTSSFQFLFSSKPASARAAPMIAALVLGHGVELRTTPAGARQPSETRPVPPEFRTARRARFPEDRTMPHPAPPVATNGAIKRVRPSAPDLPIHGAFSPAGDASHSTPTIMVAQAVAERRSSRMGLEPPTAEAQTRTREAFERLKATLEGRKPLNKKRRWPDPTNDHERRLMAESAFLSGRIHLRAEDAERALPGLHRALELRPEEHEYELYVKWAQMLVNETFQDDARRTEVQTLAARVVRENRTCALGLTILGHCVMHDGKNEAALRFFQRAADLDPRIVDPGRLAHLVSARASSASAGHVGETKRMPSRAEISARKAERGQLATPLDELVPVSKVGELLNDIRSSGARGAESTDLPRASGATRRAQQSRQDIRSSESGLHTPRGGLRVEAVSASAEHPSLDDATLATTPEAPPITETPHPPPPPPVFQPTPTAPLFTPIGSPFPSSVSGSAPASEQPSSSRRPPHSLPPPSLPPPAPADLKPPPPPIRGAMSPWQRPAHSERPKGANGPSSTNGTTPWSPSRIAPPVPQRVPHAEPARVVIEDLPTGRPNHGRIIAIALAWSASLAVTAAVFYFVGTREAAVASPSSTASTPTSALAATNAVLPTATATVSPSAVSEVVPAPSAAPTPAASIASTTAPAESTISPATTPEAPGVRAKPASSATKDGRPITTGSLRTPKAYGRRIYVDGHMIGEGGHDLTVSCGAHRVKVGSTGTEKPVSIPCGGLLELD